jgi:hypothetical protein
MMIDSTGQGRQPVEITSVQMLPSGCLALKKAEDICRGKQQGKKKPG